MLPKGPLTVLNTATNLNTPSTLKYKNVLRVVSLIGPNLETPGFYSTKNPLNFRMTPKSEDPNCSRKPRSLWLLGTNAKPHEPVGLRDQKNSCFGAIRPNNEYPMASLNR